MRSSCRSRSAFPPWDASRGAPTGIICLGGALDTVVSPARGEVALNEAAERMTAIAELARRYPHARIVFTGGSGRLDLWRCDHGGRARRAPVRELRHRQGAHHAGGQVARHAGECALHQGAGAAEAGRALAAGHLGASHAALGRPVPRERISGRGVSGRLPHARRGRSVAPVLAAERRPAPHRHRDARVGRAGRVLGDRDGRTELFPAP